MWVQETKKNVHLIKGKDICKPIEIGVLGIRRLTIVNDRDVQRFSKPDTVTKLLSEATLRNGFGICLMRL